MKVLVTGGAGFIGSHLIRLWLKKNNRLEIVNLDKLTYCGDVSRLAELRSNPRYQFVEGDICDPSVVERAMRGCDGVVHLAAETHVDRSLLNAKVFIDTNVYGTYVMLEAARKAGVKRFVHVSTDEVYGSREKGFFKEKDALKPTSPYAISKTAADFMALGYAESYGLNVSVTRGANTYGSYQYPEKVIPLFVSNAISNQALPLYGDGLHVRNWLHVEDHSEGIIKVFEKGKKGEAYNISSSVYSTNIELTKRILKILDKPLSLIQKVKDRAGHDRRYAIHPGKLKALGWKEKANFSRGLETTVRWYQENQDWWKAIKEKDRDFKEYYQKAYTQRAGS